MKIFTILCVCVCHLRGWITCFWNAKLFGMALIECVLQKTDRVLIIGIYSIIIYFSACLPSLFQCYHCWVNCPKAAICHSPMTTQPSPPFKGNGRNSQECNLQNDILGPQILHSLQIISHFSASGYVVIAFWQETKGSTLQLVEVAWQACSQFLARVRFIPMTT